MSQAKGLKKISRLCSIAGVIVSLTLIFGCSGQETPQPQIDGKAQSAISAPPVAPVTNVTGAPDTNVTSAPDTNVTSADVPPATLSGVAPAGQTAEGVQANSAFGMVAIPAPPAPVVFSSEVVLEIPFGSADGQVGFANGPEHTPFPESVQAFKVRNGQLAMADTFNGRVQIWTLDDRKCSATIVPASDAAGNFYCGIDWYEGGGFILSDALNSAVLTIGSTGEISNLIGPGFAIDHITTVTATQGGLIFLGDKGPAVDTVRVLAGGAGLVASIPVPGLTESGFAVDPSGRVLVARERADAAAPVIDIFGATNEASESVAFAPLGSVEIKNCTFPPGRFNIAGVDSSGRVFLYWAGLSEYFGPVAGQFPEDIKALPSTQMVARFNVVGPDGSMVADFFAPLSTAPEPAVVTLDGDLFVMAYDATSAPQGTVKFIKFSAR